MTVPTFSSTLFENADFILAEGIGIISPNVIYPCDYATKASTLLGHIAFPQITTIPMHYSHLYQVVDGDGTVIYYEQEQDPNNANIIPSKVNDGTEIQISDGKIVISGGEGVIYDAQGRIASRCKVGETIETNSLQRGVYIVKVGNTIRKVVI